MKRKTKIELQISERDRQAIKKMIMDLECLSNPAEHQGQVLRLLYDILHTQAKAAGNHASARQIRMSQRLNKTVRRAA